MSIESPTDRPLRADAERNRRRILAAAAEVFAARGLEASLDDIAAHAGVGVGTVYRRFADKDALIDGLFDEKLGRVIAIATEALEREDPWEGFEHFVRGASALQAEDRGFKEALLGYGHRCARLERGRETIAPLARRLIERAQRSGQLRADLDPFDVPLLHSMLGFVADSTREISPEYWQRLLQIVLDGLRAERPGPTPLDAPPLSEEQFETAMSRRRC